MEQPKAPSVTRKANKQQLKYEADLTKCVQTKTNPTKETPNTFAVIDSEREQKSQKKIAVQRLNEEKTKPNSEIKEKRYKYIEEQRLDAEGAAIAEAVALHVLHGEDFGDALIPHHGLLEYSLEELGWDSDSDELGFTCIDQEACDIVSSDLLGIDSQERFFEEAQDELEKKGIDPQKQRCQTPSKSRYNYKNAINRKRSTEAKQLQAYFQKLLSSDNPTPPSELEELISPVVTMEENVTLCAIPTVDEIKEVVKKMDSKISPGPDGKPVFTYKTHWDIVGEALVETVQHFFSTGHLSEEINATYFMFVLIANKPALLKNFRPLTICNVTYKVISKIMANRLQPILDNIISPIVRGRSISENAVIFSELVSYMTKKKGNKGFMALKLKMENAYHLIEWPFLLEAIKKHGFSEKWLLLIKQCISTTSLSILIKGVTYGKIRPKRGLRQGDPITPALFVIAADVLSRLITREEYKCNFHGTKVSRTSPRISHLLHCDTIYVFCSGELADAECLLKCLREYEIWSGQNISFEKSTVFFSKNVSKEDTERLKKTLNLSNCCSKAKNFGLLSQKGLPKNEVFNEVAVRLGTRLNSWRARSLPMMGANISRNGEDETDAGKKEVTTSERCVYVIKGEDQE
ncbi:hypothetical protein ACJIZ3_022261 [Penstemon smallii]|uniref:Reverse transcriptase domain-containing protein n=1 Tax=Penstemon smallii TaxID=265156 RepID=A0ABD3TMT6_9LAMI